MLKFYVSLHREINVGKGEGFLSLGEDRGSHENWNWKLTLHLVKHLMFSSKMGLGT